MHFLFPAKHYTYARQGVILIAYLAKPIHVPAQKLRGISELRPGNDPGELVGALSAPLRRQSFRST